LRVSPSLLLHPLDFSRRRGRRHAGLLSRDENAQGTQTRRARTQRSKSTRSLFEVVPVGEHAAAIERKGTAIKRAIVPQFGI
jgi:hypothetical protein